MTRKGTRFDDVFVELALGLRAVLHYMARIRRISRLRKERL